jgi:hypothetical protein
VDNLGKKPPKKIAFINSPYATSDQIEAYGKLGWSIASVVLETGLKDTSCGVYSADTVQGVVIDR